MRTAASNGLRVNGGVNSVTCGPPGTQLVSSFGLVSQRVDMLVIDVSLSPFSGSFHQKSL